MSLKR